MKFAFTYAFADIINDIQVKNNNRITKETILTFGGIKLGKDYSQEQLNNILLDLYSTNFFSDIKFDVQGDILVVTVQERKIVQKIVLNGIQAEKTKKAILKNLSLREKSPYVTFLAKQDIKKIENALNNAGYYFNKVDVLMKDNKNGSLFGKFESTEYGKFNIKVNDIEKDFFIGITDSKELEKVSSSSFLINSFFEKNKQ